MRTDPPYGRAPHEPHAPGSTLVYSYFSTAAGDHPRGRGEHAELLQATMAVQGPSPRERG